MLTEKIQKLLDNQGGNYILPFFWQHGEEKAVLRHYMNVIHEANIGAVCVESRPHPDFCGPKWWRDMDIILDEAKKLGMKVWILDDSHFPTGYANGAMLDKPDELCRRSLTCRTFPLKEGESLSLSGEALDHPAPREKNMAEQYTMPTPARTFDDDRIYSVCAFHSGDGTTVDLKGYIKDRELNWTAPSEGWTVYLLHLSRNYGYHPSYINMMDRASCRVLIDAVYEPHYEHYKEEFGKTIAGFFSDEPELGNGHLYDTDDPYGLPGMDYPWSAELEEKLRSRFGTDLETLLPLMWIQDADPEKTARLRYAYMDAVTRLVRKDFSEQIGDWCRERGVEYIGHLIEDDNHHTRTGSSLGHYFRGLWGQDMAGIDDIGGQVFPQGEDVSYHYHIFAHRNGEFYHYLLGKLADSAAAIQPEKAGRTMCEIFGNYGWEEGVRLEKYLTDHFLVRGINHFVPHAFSPMEYPDPDCPPHFYAGGNNPQYRHFGTLMAYTNRVAELLNGGRHIAPVAVLYHGEADWTGGHMTSDQVCHPLADAQIDYDILPTDVFADREAFRTRIDKDELHVNTQDYRALLIPHAQFITDSLAAAIEKLTQAGFPVFYIENAPEGLCLGEGAVPSAECIALSDIVTKLRALDIPDITIAPVDNRIRYRRYVHEDASEVFLFVNEGTEAWTGTVAFADQAAVKQSVPYLYDAFKNELLPASLCGNELTLTVEPLHSRILILDKTAEAGEADRLFAGDLSAAKAGEEVHFSNTWKRSVCRSIDYPAFGEAREITLPDRLAEEMPKFSGYARYENTFSSDGKAPLLLTISDAHEGVEVFLNGTSQGIQIVPPFRYRLEEGLLQGENTLTIEVATTLERENSGKPDITGRIKEPKTLSGITGSVIISRFA